MDSDNDSIEESIESQDSQKKKVKKPKIDKDTEIKIQNANVRRIFDGDQQINGVKLNLEAAYGAQSLNINNQMVVVKDQYIIFVSGCTIVCLQSDDQVQTFYYKKDCLRYVTALDAGYLKDRKMMLAVGESPENAEDPFPPMVYIIQEEHPQGWKKWIKLAHPNPDHKGTIEKIQLVPEKNLCLVVIKKFQPQLPVIYLWQYNPDNLKEKIIASQQLRQNHNDICLNPLNYNEVIIMGNSYLKIWLANLQERSFKEQQAQQQQLVKLQVEKDNNFIGHCWMVSKKLPKPGYLLIVLTNNNSIAMILNGVQQGPCKELQTVGLPFNEIDEEKEKENAEFEGFFGYNKILEDIMKEKKQQKENQQSKKEKDLIEISEEDKELNYKCICSTKKGFVVGGTQGKVCYFEFEIRNLLPQNHINFIIDKTPGVVVTGISTQENLASMTTTNKKQELIFYELKRHQVELTNKALQQVFDNGFHNARINAISICRCKSIFATCGNDKFVRIFNYQYLEQENDTSAIISHQFKDTPLDVSLHPYGIFIAVAFETGFKVFTLVHEALSHLNDINLPRCGIVRYAHGGQFIISNENSNIFIFDSIYYDTLYTLKGHSHRIHDITLSEDDVTLLSTCQAGVVYVWTLADVKEQNKAKGTMKDRSQHRGENPYTKILYDKTEDLFVGVGKKNCLSVFTKETKWECFQCRASQDWTYTCMVLSKAYNVIFFGTSTGSIVMHLWPLKDTQCIQVKIPNTNQYQMQFPEGTSWTFHKIGITGLIITPDNQYLISASEDGSMFQMKISELTQGIQQQGDDEQQKGNTSNQQQHHILPYTELFLERQTKIKEKNEKKQNLEFEVQRAEQTNKTEIQKLCQEHDRQQKQEDEDCQRILEADRKAHAEVIEKTEQDQNALKNQLEKEKRKYLKLIGDVVQQNAAKVDYEIEQNEELKLSIYQQTQKQEEQLKLLFNNHRKDIQQIKQKYKEKCTKLQVKYSVIVEKAQQRGKDKLERLDKQEADHEKYIQQNVKNLQDQIVEQEKLNEKLKDENADLITNNNKLQNKNIELQNECLDKLGLNSELKEAAIKNSADLIKMHEQLLEREQVILSKEETCKQARDESLNLENFWYMLDQKIKKQVRLKDFLSEKIKQKEKKLKAMFTELIDEASKNDTLHQEFKKKQEKIKVQENFIKTYVLEIKFWKGRLRLIENMLVRMLETPQRGAKIEIWARKLRNIIEVSEKIISGERKKVDFKDDDIKNMIKNQNESQDKLNRELFQQTSWLQKKINLINLTNNKLREIREDNIETIMNKNTELLEECNMLRGENEVLRMHMNSLKKVIKEAENKKKKLLKKKIPARNKRVIANLMGIVNEYEQSNINLQQQNQILQQIDGQMQEYQGSDQIQEDSQSRFPPLQ